MQYDIDMYSEPLNELLRLKRPDGTQETVCVTNESKMVGLA